jgi:hypothetical protein
MEMSDVKVGMRMRSIYGDTPEITVTELTTNGFCFKYDEPWVMGSRLSVSEGGEHFGHEGESLYLPVDDPDDLVEMERQRARQQPIITGCVVGGAIFVACAIIWFNLG